MGRGDGSGKGKGKGEGIGECRKRKHSVTLYCLEWQMSGWENVNPAGKRSLNSCSPIMSRICGGNDHNATQISVVCMVNTII